MFRRVAASSKVVPTYLSLKVAHDDATWEHDNVEEFFSDYRKYADAASFRVYDGGPPAWDLGVTRFPRWTLVIVQATSRSEVEEVFAVFEKHRQLSKLPPLPQPAEPKQQPVVFIGHGRSSLWLDLKNHLQDKHQITIEAFETGARAGHTIRDILEDMADKSSFALLVLTAEDQHSDGSFHARENVIHEAGLFQGRLGFGRAIVLLEDGASEFSNIHGILQIRFAKGNIKETFGDVVATIRREFR